MSELMKDKKYKMLAYGTLFTGLVSLLFCIVGLIQTISSGMKGEFYVMPAVLVIALISMGLSRTLNTVKKSYKQTLIKG
ncbi:MAG: hypothetical protein ACI92O_000300 [Colwellia sp.]|jgi:hypothetical protein